MRKHWGEWKPSNSNWLVSIFVLQWPSTHHLFSLFPIISTGQRDDSIRSESRQRRHSGEELHGPKAANGAAVRLASVSSSTCDGDHTVLPKVASEVNQELLASGAVMLPGRGRGMLSSPPLFWHHIHVRDAALNSLAWLLLHYMGETPVSVKCWPPAGLLSSRKQRSQWEGCAAGVHESPGVGRWELHGQWPHLFTGLLLLHAAVSRAYVGFYIICHASAPQVSTDPPRIYDCR